MSIMFVVIVFTAAKSQELEPRALTNIPLKTNFFIAGYAYASGNILMDLALPIENFNGKIHTMVFAYARAVNFFGKSGKIDVSLPFAAGDWKGIFEGEDFEDHSTGFGDLRIRASVNLTGAPALNPSDYHDFKQKTVSGLSLQLIIPTGDYRAGQLPNLGSNRWTIRTAYGISRTFNQWVVEGYIGVWLFSDNNQFLVNHKLSQSALWVVKSHLTRTFKKGMWLAFDCGYGYGGQTYIDDEKRDAIISGMRLGMTYALPLNARHALKFRVVTGIRFQQGGDFDAFGVAYQYRWNKQVQ
jgi:hypothetical protein